jgi:hypothetical protein
LPPGPEDHAIERAYADQKRAEELQRNPKLAVDRYVDSISGLTNRQREYLKARPVLLQPEASAILRSEYTAALQEGVPDDSDAMERRLDSRIVARLRARHNQPGDDGIEGARATVMQAPDALEPEIQKDVERLDAEAGVIRGMMHAENSMPHSLAMDLPTAGPATPSRRSLPVSAPVSRDVPTISGAKVQDSRNVTLSPEERVIARGSYSWMSHADAEREYGRQKLKLAAMRKAGTYSE